MAKKSAKTFPHIDYSNVDIYVEEAERIDSHSPAMVTVFGYSVIVTTEPKMRIIPSKKWEDNVEECAGLFSHESIHMWLLKNIGPRVSMRLDFLPRPKNIEELESGVFGLSLRWEVKQLKSA